MPRQRARGGRRVNYLPLVAFIAAQHEDSLTLTFADIEAIIGAPLSTSAQVSLSFWASPQQRFVRDLTAIGWQAHLLIHAYAVEFRRIVPGP
jgi:hypothetical protein